MRNKKELFVALALSASVFAAGSAFADTTDSTVVSKSQVVQLVPSSPAYGVWSNWIVEKLNSENNGVGYSNGASARKVFDSSVVGLITIETKYGQPTTSFRDSVTPESAGAPKDPPTPLPATGTPGEQITITDVTHTYYATWVYTWEVPAGGGGGGGGWVQTGGSFHDCGDNTDKPESVTCAQQ
jgi:hypothetical protein